MAICGNWWFNNFYIEEMGIDCLLLTHHELNGFGNKKRSESLQNDTIPKILKEFKLHDRFEAISRIQSIQNYLFSEGYTFVSFDATSLITNILQKKTFNVIPVVTETFENCLLQL